MIEFSKQDGLSVFSVSGAEDYCSVLRAFISDSSEIKKNLIYSGRTGPVWKISYKGKFYVMKHDLRRRHRFDYLVQSFFCGSNSERLIRQLDKLRERGFDGACRVFLTADNRKFGCVLDSYILMEFVEGQTLESLVNMGVPSRSFRVPVAKIVHAMLRGGMVHGDVNLGNFIKTPDGKIKAIDISGKPALLRAQAIDRKWLKYFFGVPERAGNIFSTLSGPGKAF